MTFVDTVRTSPLNPIGRTDRLAKIVLIGDSEVRKINRVSRFTQDESNPEAQISR
jgi:hypothetical protein